MYRFDSVQLCAETHVINPLIIVVNINIFTQRPLYLCITEAFQLVNIKLPNLCARINAERFLRLYKNHTDDYKCMWQA